MSYTQVIKPGTTKTQLIETDKVDFYRQYGWEPETTQEEVVVTAILKPAKKTAKPNPAVEEVVGNDITGE
jgi:hypothetical protein